MICSQLCSQESWGWTHICLTLGLCAQAHVWGYCRALLLGGPDPKCSLGGTLLPSRNVGGAGWVL